MSVVLRCPSCGTTRASTGECEACHEAQVRYFCGNHTPGLWLETSTCAKCGARLGDPPRRPSPRARPIPTPAARPSRPPVPAREPTPYSPPPAYVPEYAPERPRRARSASWGPRERLPDRRDEELGPRASPLSVLQELLRAAVRSRYGAPREAPDYDGPPAVRRTGGCVMRLVRLVLILVFLFIALVIALFVFSHTML